MIWKIGALSADNTASMMKVIMMIIDFDNDDDIYVEKEDGSSEHSIQYGENAKQCWILKSSSF